MIETIFPVLEQGLRLWNTKESRKYLDQVIELKRKWYEEYNKPQDIRSDAVLDNIQFELRILSLAFVSNSGKQNASDKP